MQMNSLNLGTKHGNGSYLYSSLPKRGEHDTCDCPCESLHVMTSCGRNFSHLTTHQLQRLGKYYEKWLKSCQALQSTVGNATDEQWDCRCPDWQYHIDTKCSRWTFGEYCDCPEERLHVETCCGQRFDFDYKQIKNYSYWYPEWTPLQEYARNQIETTQGANVTKIYGNNDIVTANAGANGWRAVVPVAAPGGNVSLSNSGNQSGPIPGVAIPTGSGVESNKSAKGAGTPVPTKFKPTTNSARTGMDTLKTVNGVITGIGTTASNVAQTASSLHKSWGSMMDIMDPLLDDPNMEEGFSISDRVSATTSGTTIVQTQDSIPIRTAYMGGSYGFTPSMDVPTCPGPAVERFNNVAAGEWSVSDSQWKEIYSNGVLKALLSTDTVPGVNSSTVFTRTLTNHVLWRAAFDVQLQVNPSQFHQGSLVLCAMPAEIDPMQNPHQVFSYPYQILNLRTVNTARLSLPFISVTPVADIYEDPWNIYVFVLTPLAAAANTPNTLPFNIVVSPRQVEFQGLNFTQVPFEPTQHIKVRRVPASNSFGNNVPGQEVEFASFAPQAPPCDWVPGEVYDYLEMARIPTVEGNLIEWSQAKPTGTLLSTYVVQPYKPESTTYLSLITSNFAQYRGPINFYFMFTGARQHYGKLLVAYNPNPFVAPSTMAEAMQGVYTIWDVGLNSTLKFTVPYISSIPWRPTQSGVTLSTGFVTVWVYNELMGPSNVTNTAMIVPFVGASESYQLRLPVLPTYSYINPTPQEDVNVESTQSDTLTNMETGMADEGATAPEEVVIGSYDPLMDTNIAAWFSQYRLGPWDSAMQWTEVKSKYIGGTYYASTLDLSSQWLTAGPNQFSTMLSLFTYFRGDLKIKITTITPPDGAWVRLVHVPVGASAVYDYALLDSYPEITWVPTATDPTICVRIPYNSPNTVISPHAYTTKSELLPLSSWGQIVIVSSTKFDCTFSTAIDGFRGWCPRPCPRQLHPQTNTHERVEKTQMLRMFSPGLYSTCEMLKQENTVGKMTKTLENLNFVLSKIDHTKASAVLDAVQKAPEVFNDFTEEVRRLGDVLTPQRVEKFLNSVESLTTSVHEGVAIAGGLEYQLNNFTEISGSNPMVKILVKAVGYILILTSNPSLQTLIGASILAASDFAGNFSAVAVIQWLYDKFGWEYDGDECIETGQSLKQLNELIATTRNVKWTLEQTYALVQSILNKIQNKVENDPRHKLELALEEIETMHIDSLKVQDLVDIDWEQVEQNIKRCRELIKLATDAKDTLTSRQCYTIMQNYINAKAEAKKISTGVRIEPVVVYLHGLPGCGKSLISTLLAAAICKQKKLNYSQSVYTPPPNSEYMDGYAGQYVHVIDDIGQAADGEDWAQFVNMVSPVPFLPNMAFRKGIPYTSRLIIASSNFSSPNDLKVRSKEALERRLHIKCHVEVKSGFESVRGRINGPLATTPLEGESKYFEKNAPIINGTALRISMGKQELTLDELVEHTLNELNVRENRTLSLLTLIPEMGQNQIVEKTQVRVMPSKIQALEVLSKLEFSNSLKTLKQRLSCGWKVAAAALVGIATLVGLWLYSTKPAVQATEAAYDPMAMRKKKKNIPLSTPCVTPEMAEKFQNNEWPHEVFNAIDKSTYPILFESADFSCSQTCFGVIDDMYVVNWHSWSRTTSFTFRGHVYKTSEISSWHPPNTDLVYFRIPDQTKTRNMTRFFIPLPPCSKNKLNLLSKRFEVKGCAFELDVVATKIVTGVGYQRVPVRKIETDGEVSAVVDCFSFLAPTYPGLCGSPTVLMDPSGPKILGIHISGLPGKTGTGETLWNTWIEALHILNPEQHQAKAECTGEAYPPAYVPRVSALKPSPYYGMVTPTKMPAVLRQSDPRLGEGVILDQVIFGKYTTDFDKQWPSLAPAMDLYFSRFDSTFPQISMHEAINGIPGLDGIDMNQSAGYPYVTTGRSRRSFFTLDEDGYHPTMELKNAVMEVLNGNYGKYMTFLKDELRDVTKVEAGKTRIVDAANLPSIIAGRMIFGSFFAYMHKNVGIKHGSAVGCNPDFHWTQFYYDFTDSENVWDLDYSAYDSSIPSFAFQMLATHLDRLCLSPHAYDYVMHLASTQHVYGNVEMIITGGMPSGCIGTSIFNTILNNCFVLSALITHPEFNPLNFKCLAYGDDVIYSTQPDIHPSYIKQFYDENTPFKVTPADKDGIFPDHSSIHDVMFLKRWFYPDGIHPGLVRPIIHPSVYYQSAMWMRDGDIQDTLTSLSYLAFHAGPNNYAKWIATCKTKSQEHYFLPWSYLDHRWWLMCHTGEIWDAPKDFIW
ncbi:polyprotein [rafivirus B1]|uniref:Genome polyprotein n=1 Tax=rafivirus B1 TaxID=2116187 RepID=A0A2P1GN97_9PICO|nr:polyprotein [rafivirus B1]AVM87448.1 polyprotein [rafivirus B1]